MTVADTIWLATALLHREHPEREDFSTGDILRRAIDKDLGGIYRPGLPVHVSTHCVAVKPPNPARYRTLHETARGRRRLFRSGDPYHPNREGGKIRPEKSALPSGHAHLVDWYDRVYCRSPNRSAKARTRNLEVRFDFEELRKNLARMPVEELRNQLLSVLVRPGRNRPVKKKMHSKTRQGEGNQ